jgi:hypothetical protein
MIHGGTGHAGVGDLDTVVLLADSGDEMSGLELKGVNGGVFLVSHGIGTVGVFEVLLKVGAYGVFLLSDTHNFEMLICLCERVKCIAILQLSCQLKAMMLASMAEVQPIICNYRANHINSSF